MVSAECEREDDTIGIRCCELLPLCRSWSAIHDSVTEPYSRVKDQGSNSAGGVSPAGCRDCTSQNWPAQAPISRWVADEIVAFEQTLR